MTSFRSGSFPTAFTVLLIVLLVKECFLPCFRKRLESSFHQDLWKKASRWKYLHQGAYWLCSYGLNFCYLFVFFCYKVHVKRNMTRKIFFFFIEKLFFRIWVGPIFWKCMSKSGTLHFYKNIVSFDDSNMTLSKVWISPWSWCIRKFSELHCRHVYQPFRRIYFWACTDRDIFFLLCSQDKDANDKDNKKVFSIPVKFEADVEIRGYIFI